MERELLKKYAKLIVEVGINPNKGQKLIINCPVECAEFGRLCVEAGYNAGCGEVIMVWSDDTCTRLKYLHAEESVFESYPRWQKTFFDDYAAVDAAKLSIYATDPENLKGVSPQRIAKLQRVAGTALADYSEKQMNNSFPWCVASVPIESWAVNVFKGESANVAIDKLWDAILKTVRVDSESDPVELWKKHINSLNERKEKLNAYSFKYLKYKNALGTDLVVELPEGHFWEAGCEKAGTGQTFVPNIPTEEIFTTPKKDGVNGVVCASMPLVLDGSIIENIRLTIENGKIVNATADTNLEVLLNALYVDEGASYLGEVALVPNKSPISDMGILFYNTLFDENAACHFAFGDSYPMVKGASQMSQSEKLSHGLNKSIIHEDFMVGTEDLSITGITHNGDEVAVFRNGNFSF